MSGPFSPSVYNRIWSYDMRMYQVDAFTDALFGGNPAAVMLLESWMPDALMLAIAKENNLAETAFAKRRDDGSWDLRWFSPAHEVDFCGHATLATAHVLFAHSNASAALVFHSRVGVLRVTRRSKGYCLEMPRFDPQVLDELPHDIGETFDAVPDHLFCNFENVFADLGSAKAVRDFAPDLLSIAKMGATGLVVTGKEAEGAQAHFVSRYFAPGAGIPEDPVTGSIYATLVPYWGAKLGLTSMTAYQASARGGWLICELEESRVLVTGNAVTFMEPEIMLPNTAA